MLLYYIIQRSSDYVYFLQGGFLFIVIDCSVFITDNPDFVNLPASQPMIINKMKYRQQDFLFFPGIDQRLRDLQLLQAALIKAVIRQGVSQAA